MSKQNEIILCVCLSAVRVDRRRKGRLIAQPLRQPELLQWHLSSPANVLQRHPHHS